MSRGTFSVFVVLICFFVGGASLMFAQDCPPGSTELRVFREQDILAIYVPEGTASLKGLSVEVDVQGQPSRFFLDNYSEFKMIKLDHVQGPHCLRLEVPGANPNSLDPLCRELPPDQQTIQMISADQNFWFDNANGQPKNLALRQFSYDVKVCPSAEPACVVQWPPLAEPIALPCSHPVLCELYLDPTQIDGAEKFAFAESGGQLTDEFNQGCARSGSYGLQIDFNMPPGGFGGWGTHWDFALGGAFDASAYDYLTFWLKSGETRKFQIGISDTFGQEDRVDLDNWVILRPDEWAFFRVPLDRFPNVDFAHVKNINLGFNQDHGQGSLCIDNIGFAWEGQTLGAGTINARCGPSTACEAIESFHVPVTVFGAVSSIEGEVINGDPEWVLGIHDDRYLYLHNSVIESTATPTVEPSMLIADFDPCERSTNNLILNDLGGEIGSAFDDTAPNSASEECVSERGNTALRFNYNIQTWAALWMKLNGANFSGLSTLQFDMRADPEIPFDVKVELKRNDNTEMGIFYVSDVGDVFQTWQTFEIPLARFSSVPWMPLLSDWTNMSELVFIVDSDHANANSPGTLYIDNVRVK